MIIVVSPYHLTTREPAALAAMLLADRVVTMLPAPLEGKEWSDVRGAAVRVPRYLEFMASWQWTVPLWKAGVIGSGIDGHEAVAELRAVCERIDRDPKLAPLRVLMKPDLFEDHERYLDSLARDLLKAGPDPGITVPVAAGLDAFASRQSGGAFVARSEPVSVVQRAEAQLGEKAFGVAVPVLLQAEGERILEARELLEAELRALRSALDAYLGGAAGDEAIKARLNKAAKEYAEAFESNRETLLMSDSKDEIRIVEGTVMLTGMRFPAECVYESSLRAMRTMGPMRAPAAEVEGAPQTRLLAGEVGEPAKVMAMYVRVLGRSASAASSGLRRARR